MQQKLKQKIQKKCAGALAGWLSHETDIRGVHHLQGDETLSMAARTPARCPRAAVDGRGYMHVPGGGHLAH